MARALGSLAKLSSFSSWFELIHLGIADHVRHVKAARARTSAVPSYATRMKLYAHFSLLDTSSHRNPV